MRKYTISICIATYKRPKLLLKLLDSLNNQENCENYDIEIVVVDNDPLLSAKPIVEDFKKQSLYNISYFSQKEQNIALTRNVAVKNASGELIAFIDDDEYATSMWLYALVTTLVKYKADGVWGPIHRYYNDSSESKKLKCFFKDKTVPLTGAVLKMDFLDTANCMVKASEIKKYKGPFNAMFGLTGGSDTRLFWEMQLNGNYFISCDTAIVYELVSEKRLTWQWIIQRSFRKGFTYTLIYTDIFKLPLLKIKEMFKSIVIVVVCIILILPSFFVGKKVFLLFFNKLIGHIGHIWALLGKNYDEYKKYAGK